MTIALLATGDELIQGDVLNTNSHYLAHALNSEGLPVNLHLVCGDREVEILDSIRFLAKNHDILIITGGLGPTSDDRTRFALANFLQTPLVEHPAAIEHIHTYLKLDKPAINLGNRQQTLFPPGATLFPNPRGTAMGCYLSVQNKLFILLPGPPYECLFMFNNHVLPLLEKTQHVDTQLLKWRLFGVAESQIAQQIDDALAGIDCQTGYRWEPPYVECKVRCKSALLEKVNQILKPIISPHIIATTVQKASERLYEMLVQTKIPISIRDEATGGILQTLIQQPTTYSLVKFYEDDKALLHFHLGGLKDYWLQTPNVNTTQVTIHYRSKNRQGEENHEIPYRTALVVHYAAEWLCFRLFHLINQLHQGIT